MILELDRVSKSYRAASETVHAVTEASLSIDTGEIVVLFGPSGAGKSTLLLLAAGALQPDHGAVRYRGRSLSDLSDRELSTHLREHVGIAYQAPQLLAGHDTLTNAAIKLAAGPMSLKEARRAALPVLARVRLGDRLAHRPHQLSGGEQRRVALARALTGDPPLLLLDEPTANLDTVRTEEILDVIASAASAGAAVLLVTHDRAAERIASRTIELRDGSLPGTLRAIAS